MNPTVPSAAPNPRFDIVDLARGVALVGMFVFHLGWDVTFLGLVDHDIPADWRWIWLARVVAGSFLTLTGFSLVLATRTGLRWPAFLRRLALVAGAALLVTLGTRFMVPQAYVTFGILHHIALASVLCLAVLRWPVWLIGLTAAVAMGLPRLAHDGILTAALFDHPFASWLGLGSMPPAAVDFVPVFPWIGCVLAGVALGRLLVDREALPRWQARGRVARLLAFGGRHSLAVYLVHQPVFIALLMGLSLVLDRSYTPDPAVFTQNCESACQTTGLGAQTCQRSCACTIDRIKTGDLWDKTLAGRLSGAEQQKIRDIAGLCLRAP